MDFGTPEHELALKRDILVMLVQEAQADHHLSPPEKRYLPFEANNIGISNTEVATICMYPESYEIAPPTNEPARINMMRDSPMLR
jgi:hypothetical protein